VQNDYTETLRAKNRRIEFSIVVREENVGQIIQEYLDSLDDAS